MSSATVVEVPSNPDLFEGESPASTQSGKPGKTSKAAKSDKSRKLPDVLSVQRGTIISDGIMFSLVPKADGSLAELPLRVIRHGIRGINNNPKNGDAANIQRTESAKTSPDAIGLRVAFAYRTIDAKQLLFACADPAYRAALDGFVERFFREGVPEFEEVCRRYARNILNGRWLWRNRVLGEVSVTATYAGGHTYSSTGSRLRDFDAYTDDERALAENVIRAGLLGHNTHISVQGDVRFGFKGEVEVFPSQNMVTAKPKGFARSLYKVDMIARKDLIAIMSGGNKDGEDAGEFAADMIDMGRAALRDQKIGNAIRSIDTWYPGCQEAHQGMPIPIEPNGASLEHNRLFRDTDKSGAKDLLTLVDELQPSDSLDPRAAYLIALLVRGGVFSEKQ
ncbi:MAG: type I-F CRISPR-associated protein Csy3 [Serpentinimonas sp.]|nr:type I-F CRISPR-associated protein Csy3 [Serpentinimonas sp.]MDO9610839.1 type I-F CRISPR-associated protein Csy3 [Serpentinimonas sp.]